MNENIKKEKESIIKELLKNKQKNNFNILLEQTDNFDEYHGKESNIYYVSEYSINSEEYTHIKKIIPLKITLFKRIIYIFLNIITFGVINLFMNWFPSLKCYIRYNETSLLEATYLGVYGIDGEMDIIKIQKINFPSIDLEKNSIITSFGLNLKSMKEALMFNYKSYDYIYNENTSNFEILYYRIKCPKNKILNECAIGLFPNEVEFLKLIFGKCDIDIQLTKMKKILLDELSDPFYLFEIYSIILWLLTGYYFYSSIIIILTLIGFIISIKETYPNLKKIEELSKYSCPVNIYRKNIDGKLIVQTLSSLELVPGDLFEVPDEGITLPCDSILVKGSVVINESMLTGESNPIVKSSLENTDEIFDSKLDNRKYILYSGTKVLQKKNNNKKDKILAMVIDTGFRTFKGQMLTPVIFPNEEDEEFRHDSLKYIFFMVIICFIGYFSSLKYLIEAEISDEELTLIFFELFICAVPPSLPTCMSLGLSYSLHRLKKFDIFCIDRERINPLGSINTIVFDKTGTLTENLVDINGFIPTIINNKLNVFEFGDFSSDSKQYFNIIKEYITFKKKDESYINKNKDLLKLYFECLACCHCLSNINNKIVGDPIDVKMFEKTGWEIEDNQNEDEKNNLNNDDNNKNKKILYVVKPKNENNNNSELNNYKIEVYKRFDFNSNLQRMSIIGKDINENYFKIFCKGSPEKIKQLCLAETIPINFDETLDYYASKGYRLLAMACQFINIEDFSKIDLIKREKVEDKMIFLGFIIITNKLKPDTKSTIITLDNADLRMLMVTGDNILTAISVSRECNIVNKDQEIFSLNLEKDENDKEYFFWDKINDNKLDNKGNNKNNIEENINTNNKSNYNDLIEDKSLITIYRPKEIKDLIISSQNKKEEKNIKENDDDNLSAISSKKTTSRSRHQSISSISSERENQIQFIDDFSPFKLSKTNNYSIAITGEAFSKLSELNQLYLILKKKIYLKSHQVFRFVLKNGKIFARMNPQHKALLVESLKNEGLNPLMCGDGSNDCLALRKANVGVSLSLEEASIAAHFTSLNPGISCLIHLLREGKCSLATSIQVFKYVISESMIQFISLILVMIYNSYFSDPQFLLGDIFISFPVISFYLTTNPTKELTYKYPLTGILTFPVLISIIFQIIFIFLFQFCGNLFLKKIYKWETNCGYISDTDIPVSCEENTILFIISNFQFVFYSITFYTSKPFRQSIFKNWYHLLYYIVIIFYMTWYTINCDKISREIFMIYDFELNYTRYDNTIFSSRMFKYILFFIVIINFITIFVYEKVLVKCFEIFWNKNRIKNYKKEIDEAKDNNVLNEVEYYDEISLFKYNDVFYYDRRFGENSKIKKKPNKKVNGENFIELIGAKDNNNINSDNK